MVMPRVRGRLRNRRHPILKTYLCTISYTARGSSGGPFTHATTVDADDKEIASQVATRRMHKRFRSYLGEIIGIKVEEKKGGNPLE